MTTRAVYKWWNDVDWVEYDEALCARIEAARVAGKSARVRIDADRYVAVDGDEFLQQRYDDPDRQVSFFLKKKVSIYVIC